MQKIVQVDLHRDFDTSHSPLEQADLQDPLQCLVLCLVQTQSKCSVTLPCIGFHGWGQSYSLLWKFWKNLLLSFRAAGQGSKNLAKDIIQTCVWSRESLAVTRNSLNHSPGWLWALDLPVSAFWVVRPQACSTMPRFWKSNPHSISNEGSLSSWRHFDSPSNWLIWFLFNDTSSLGMTTAFTHKLFTGHTLLDFLNVHCFSGEKF